MRTEYLEFIIGSGLQVLKMYEDEANQIPEQRYSWWVCYKFEAATTAEEFGVTFHTVTGIDVTEFVRNNTIDIKQMDFLSKLQAFIDARKKITCKFHHAIKWRLFMS